MQTYSTSSVMAECASKIIAVADSYGFKDKGIDVITV